MIAKRLLFLVVVVALAGCASQSYDQPIKIDSHFNPDGAYGTYETWDWVKYQNQPAEGVLADAAFRLELANMVDKALTDRGLTRVFESPDLEVGFHAATEMAGEEQLREWYDQYDWNLPAYSGASSNAWQKGALLLFVFEAESGKLLWRSSAEAIVDTSAPEKERKKLVERAIQKMLDEMPQKKQK
jgi:hypothetical protein